jgi:hypothetical protein
MISLSIAERKRKRTLRPYADGVLPSLQKRKKLSSPAQLLVPKSGKESGTSSLENGSANVEIRSMNMKSGT